MTRSPLHAPKKRHVHRERSAFHTPLAVFHRRYIFTAEGWTGSAHFALGASFELDF